MSENNFLPESPIDHINKPESLPYQKENLVTSLYRQAPNKKQFMAAMKKNGISVEDATDKTKKVNITPIDFFATCPDLTDEEITEAIEGYLGVENLEDKLEMINDSVEKSKDYIKNYLHKSFPKEIENLPKIKTVNDVLKLFRKTAATKIGDKIGLAPFYCALVSVAVANFEFRKGELDGLIKESEFLYNEIFKSDEGKSGVVNFHRLEKRDFGYDKVFIYDEKTNGNAMAEAYFRGKSEDSIISKFLNKPEATADEATKDGIGIKFEMQKKEDIKKMIPFLARYFGDKFNAKNITFENTRLLDDLDKQELKFEFGEDKNPHSNEKFQSFKMVGKLEVPKNGDSESVIVSRQFEIQIVLAGNENESKFSNHHVYEASKKLSIVTRLYGSFTDEYLELICDEASKNTGIDAGKIKEYIKENFLVELRAGKNNKKRYADKKNVNRFRGARIFSEEIKIREIQN